MANSVLPLTGLEKWVWLIPWAFGAGLIALVAGLWLKRKQGSK
jgi:LPXTG-motif cell wall-anchored protein